MKAGNTSYMHASDVAETIPVFPLTGALLLPGGHMPLNIFEPRYLEMIDAALGSDKLVGMIQPCLQSKPSHNEAQPNLSKVGCVGRITACQETGDGRYLINLAGVCRFSVIEEVNANTSYRQCRISPFEQDLLPQVEHDTIDRDAVIAAFRKYLTANDIDADWQMVEQTDDRTLVNALCMMSPYDPAEKQALLEADTLCERAEKLVAISEFHMAQFPDSSPGRMN